MAASYRTIVRIGILMLLFFNYYVNSSRKIIMDLMDEPAITDLQTFPSRLVTVENYAKPTIHCNEASNIDKLNNLAFRFQQ